MLLRRMFRDEIDKATENVTALQASTPKVSSRTGGLSRRNSNKMKAGAGGGKAKASAPSAAPDAKGARRWW